jgi:hypothetical protein
VERWFAKIPSKASGAESFKIVDELAIDDYIAANSPAKAVYLGRHPRVNSRSSCFASYSN